MSVTFFKKSNILGCEQPNERNTLTFELEEIYHDNKKVLKFVYSSNSCVIFQRIKIAKS